MPIPPTEAATHILYTYTRRKLLSLTSFCGHGYKTNERNGRDFRSFKRFREAVRFPKAIKATTVSKTTAFSFEARERNII